MPFPVGADVRVIALGKMGRVVETARSGRYRVRVGGVVMLCREEELAEAESGDRRRGRGEARASRTTGRNVPTDGGRIESIDLHGLTVEEAVRAVEERLDRGLRAGIERLDIIHGRSSGRIKAAVHRLLRELPPVRHFEIAPGNPGVTRVFF